MSSTIYATRLGFSYQDKYACYLFLNAVRDGNIREFYTDFPFGEQLSLDILLKVGFDEDKLEERVYEIKTGKSFKNDKKYKERQSSEIKDVINNFIQYADLSPDFKGFISYSKGVKLQLLKYRNPADILINNPRFSDKAKISAKDLKETLSIKRLDSMRAVYDFFQRVKFDEIPYTNDETWTSLDERITSHIHNIATSLDATVRSYELPDEYLAAKLMFLIQKHAGSGDDITKILLKESWIL